MFPHGSARRRSEGAPGVAGTPMLPIFRLPILISLPWKHRSNTGMSRSRYSQRISRSFIISSAFCFYKCRSPCEPLSSLSGIRIMSMNMFLEEESSPVVWRGPMVSSAIKQFYSDVDWGRLDYLLVDLPPGTSDAPMTVLQSLPVDGVVIVSSPQLLATMVVKKCINMVLQLKGIIVGDVENMAYFETPNGECYEIFGQSNGPELVDMTGAPLLAQLPIDPVLTSLCDAGRIEEYRGSAYEMLADNFVKTLKIKR